MQPIRFIHTSDIHLDGKASQGRTDAFKNVAEHAFSEVVKAVRAENCDFFLIVGDLFDHNRILESDIEFVQTQLATISCPVILIPGNHDVHDDTTIWHEFDARSLGDHVIPILESAGQIIDFAELRTRVWGRAMNDHTPANVPLADLPTPLEDYWNIGLAHGQVVAKRVDGSSSQITHDEIADSGFDYLALGHVHVWEEFLCGKTHAVYPGSPVAAYASSRGGHYALVTLDPNSGYALKKERIGGIHVSAPSSENPLYV